LSPPSCPGARGVLAAVIATFAAARLVAYAAGVRFDLSPLPEYWQYIDPELLRTRLVESLFYLHSQPPLYNLQLGLGLKLAGTHFGTVMHAMSVAAGLALAISMFLLLRGLGLSRLAATGISVVVTISPAALLYENWLFYEYEVTALLVCAAAALRRYESRRTFGSALAFFALLAAIVFMRSAFHGAWLLLALVLVVLGVPESRRLTLGAAAVPVLAVALLYFKNLMVFGVLATSSWFGMNVAQATVGALWVPQADRADLVRDGTLSRVALVRPFASVEDYAGFIALPKTRGIPVLDEPRKSSGYINFNHEIYIAISRKYLRDSIVYATERRLNYPENVARSLRLFFRPSHDYALVATNAAAIRPWGRLFDVLYVRVHGIAWGLLLVYIVAGASGVRVARANGSVTLGFMWLTLAYVVFTQTLTEVGENHRMRFLVDPFALALAACAVCRFQRDRR
jgi:hypothetical protein